MHFRRCDLSFRPLLSPSALSSLRIPPATPAVVSSTICLFVIFARGIGVIGAAGPWISNTMTVAIASAGGGNVHPDAFAIVGHLQGGERLGEQIRPRCRIENRHEQYPVTGPVEHMQVQLPHLLRASAPGKLMGERAGGGSINRLAVGPQPCPHFLQPIEFRRRDDAVGGGADVEQFIAALADNIDQVAQQRARGLKFVSAESSPRCR